MIPSTARFVVGESHEPTARRPSRRPVSPSSGEDHRSSSSPSAVRGDNRLGFSGEALQFGMSGGAGAAAAADKAGGGVFILKHMHNLSDEVLCDRLVENPYFQYFCGEVVFRHEAPFDRSPLTRWSPAAGRGAHHRAAAGKPFGRASHRCDRDQRSRAGGRRHHRAGEGDHASQRRPARTAPSGWSS